MNFFQKNSKTNVGNVMLYYYRDFDKNVMTIYNPGTVPFILPNGIQITLKISIIYDERS